VSTPKVVRRKSSKPGLLQTKKSPRTIFAEL
jgi:hypothetical protein